MNAFNIIITSLGGKIYDDSAESLTAPGSQGSFGILAGHAPMISELASGVITVKKDKTEFFFAIDSGTLEVGSGGGVTVLADQAVKSRNLDEAKQAAQRFGAPL